MTVTATEFRAYFEAELAQLREQAAEFGREYPDSAHALALSGGRSRDPHVELLVQSFAFLAGRLRHQLDRDAALLPNALMAQLYPHLDAPIPTLCIAALTVDPKGANFEEPVHLERGREFRADAVDDDGRPVHCRMTTTCVTPLVPIEVAALRHLSPNAFDELGDDRRVQSVLHLRLRATGTDPLPRVDRLRFHISETGPQAYRLYDLLALHLVGVAVRPARDGARLRRVGGEDLLRWLGFDDDEAAIGADLVTHPGYRLLQEYFAFPEKYLFFELAGADLAGAGAAEAEILLLLDAPVDPSLELKPHSLRLNCVPLINLFPQRIEPLTLDQSHYEYRLSGDWARHAHTEIYRVESLSSIRPGEAARPIWPYFALSTPGRLEKQDYFYVIRRVESVLRRVPGTETYVSFLDPDLCPTRPSEEVIGGRAICTNRALATQLRIGSTLKLEGPGPLKAARVWSRPTPHQTPALLGNQPWALLSQLHLNHLSLQGKKGLGALKRMLRMHVGRFAATGDKEIDSITSLTVTPSVLPRTIDQRRALVEAMEIEVMIDPRHFEGGSPVLFGEILRRFFALYAAVNTLTEFHLSFIDQKGVVKSWPAMVGAQIVL